MTSFIVTARNKEKRLSYINDYCAKLDIDRFDITFIEKDNTTSKNTTSIGIEDVKNMQKKIFLRPIKSQTKAIVIEESHLLTPEAQNALLKVLEEPPMHTIIVLSAESKDSLLPTIISRCQVITLEEEKLELTPKELLEYIEFIKKLPALSVGDRLKKAEVLAKDKQKAVQWIEKLLLALRENIIKTYSSSEAQAKSRSDSSQQARAIRDIQQLHTLLKTTNANPRFAIEDTLLGLTK
jgi:DNA polymerase III delta prime subunit